VGMRAKDMYIQQINYQAHRISWSIDKTTLEFLGEWVGRARGRTSTDRKRARACRWRDASSRAHNVHVMMQYSLVQASQSMRRTTSASSDCTYTDTDRATPIETALQTHLHRSQVPPPVHFTPSDFELIDLLLLAFDLQRVCFRRRTPGAERLQHHQKQQQR
jgi:hypothetical protein